jgi:hypothetical protein
LVQYRREIRQGCYASDLQMNYASSRCRISALMGFPIISETVPEVCKRLFNDRGATIPADMRRRTSAWKEIIPMMLKGLIAAWLLLACTVLAAHAQLVHAEVSIPSG